MKVIVDTSVWSLALRRDKGEPNAIVNEFRHMIQDHRVQMIGPIRQEILSGIRSESQFTPLLHKRRLRILHSAFYDFKGRF